MGIKQDRIIDLARRDPAATDAQIAVRADASESYVARVRRSHGLRARTPAAAAHAAAAATLAAKPSTAADSDETADAIAYLASVCDGAVALDDVGFSSSTVGLGHQLAALDDWDEEERAAALGILWAHRRQLDAAGFDTSNWRPPTARARRVRDVAVLRSEGGKVLVSGIDGARLMRGLGDQADAVTHSRRHQAWMMDNADAAGDAGKQLTDLCLAAGVPVKITDSVPADVAAPISARVAEVQGDMRRWLAQLEKVDRLPGFAEAKDVLRGRGVHYHTGSDGVVWVWDHDAREPMLGAGPVDAVRNLGRTFDGSYPAVALASNSEHSAAAIAAALARYRNKLAAERGPGVLFPDRGKATVGGVEADPAEVDAAYADLCKQRETAGRRAAQHVEAAVAQNDAQEAARVQQTAAAKSERAAARAEQQRQHRAEAWQHAATAPVCDHTRSRDGRILVVLPDSETSPGVYCVERDGERSPVETSGRPFQARYGRFKGRMAVWATPVPRPG